MARRAIEHFQSTALVGGTLLIQTIEPSLERDLKIYLNASFANDFSFSLLERTDISKKTKKVWLENFDKEDYYGLQQSCYKIEKLNKKLR
jgi:hypothetical protein